MTIDSCITPHHLGHVLGAHGVDAAVLGALIHQQHEIGPDAVELSSRDLVARPKGRDVVAEEHLGPIDVADAGEDSLIHQQRTD